METKHVLIAAACACALAAAWRLPHEDPSLTAASAPPTQATAQSDADLLNQALKRGASAAPAPAAKQQLDPDGQPYPPPSRGEPDYPFVDFTFALQCRELEGMPNFHKGDTKIFVTTSSWDTAVVDYEKASKEAEAANDWSGIQKWWLGPVASKTTHIESYWDNVLVAYNHGEVDGQSTPALFQTHVYQVTPNVIRVGSPGIPAGAYGYPVDGFFDRKTGHGEIIQYEMNEPRVITSRVQKMYLFQCEAAKPNKF